MAAAPISTAVETRSRRAKRARTEVADPPDALSGTPASHTKNWRDWANLTDGPVGLIAEEVLADDVAGYLCFRAVCGSWRRCTPSPHTHDGMGGRFHPRRWIMLPEVFAGRITRCDFLNVLTVECIRVDLPKLPHQFVIGPTSEGLILLCRKRNGEVRLLNPFTKQLVTLPNATSLLSPLKSPYNSRWKSSTQLRKLKKLQAFNAGFADGSTMALHFNDHELELAVAKPNDESYYSITAPLDSIIATSSFMNRFYCFTGKGIKVVDATHDGHRPQLAAVEVDEDFHLQCRYYANLVDNDGQLLLLGLGGRRLTPTYEMHRNDLDTGEMVPMRDLLGRAVFISDSGTGRGRSLSVHAGVFL